MSATQNAPPPYADFTNYQENPPPQQQQYQQPPIPIHQYPQNPPTGVGFHTVPHVTVVSQQPGSYFLKTPLARK